MSEREAQTLRWYFGEKRRDEPERNPIPAEFFVHESRDLAENIVREAIQNALDARTRTADGAYEPARVRFYFSGTEGALPSQQVNRWFAGLAPHLASASSGLTEPPLQGGTWKRCVFLTCEDFGTCGLTGCPEQCASLSDEGDDNFYNFFRADALSSKGEGQGGTWGVGKTVFSMASDANAFFGLTVQQGNPSRLLMGRCILRYHRIDAGGPMYRSDGFFGLSPDDEGLVMPLRDPVHTSVLDDFARDFCVTRRPGEPGLSVVVPWCEPDEANGGVTIGTLRQAVLKHFFWALVTGELCVTLASPGHEERMAADTLRDSLGRLETAPRRDIEPFVELSKWALEQRIGGRVHVLQSVAENWHDHPPDWHDCLDEDSMEHITKDADEGRRAAVRVPLVLKRKRPRCDQPSYIDVFMEQTDESLRPAFHRGLLLICDEPRRPQTVQDCRAIVIADHFGIARFLSLAEVPSHDHWEATQQKLTNQYAYAGQLLTFVRTSVKYIASHAFGGASAEKDYSSMAEFFPRPQGDNDQNGSLAGAGSGGGKERTPETPRLRGSRPHLSITGSGGRVTVKAAPGRTDNTEITGRTLVLCLAYDIRRGDPLRHWQPEDFRLDTGDFHIRHEGLSNIHLAPNVMTARIDRPDFRVDIEGFEPRRDVYVKANVD